MTSLERCVKHLERCAELGHPGDTFNPWLGRTWCRCGEVVVEGRAVILPKWRAA